MERINIMISFVEILSTLLIYSILFNKKTIEQLWAYVVMALVTSLLYYVLVGNYFVDQIIALVGGLFLNAIIVSKTEKKDTIVTFIELIVSGILVLGFELITTFIIHILLGEHDVNATTYCGLITIIMFSLIYFLSTISRNKKVELKGFFGEYKEINIIILNLFMFFLLIKVIAVNNLVTTSVVVQITILLLILIGINSYFYAYLYKMLNKKKKNEIQKSFNPLISELMGKLKANEHEYNNHLNAIWGIAQVAKPEEVAKKVKDYIGNLARENEEFTRLLHIDNTIIKAVLYNKMQRAEKLGVTCTYSIQSGLINIPVDDSELTVIFSNLLNNAIEATSMIKKKEVYVLIDEDSKRYYISVKNRVENLNSQTIANMFKIGYSTKGEGRGYGLYNVKKIVDKYKGKIEVCLEDDIITLRIIFNK